MYARVSCLCYLLCRALIQVFQGGVWMNLKEADEDEGEML